MQKIKLYAILLTYFIVSPFLFSQKNIEVPEGKYPYSAVYEWYNRGTILINSDPTENARDHNIMFINADAETQWKETFYPKNHNPKLILSHNSNYIYFLEEIGLRGNKVLYHQISKSGSVKSSSFDVLSSFKKLGIYDPSNTDLVDVVNTSEALVFQFIYENKSTKNKDDILVFLTHHNHKIHVVKALETPLELMKKDIAGALHFAGCKNETIYFSNYQKVGNRPAIVFHGFSVKAEPKDPEAMILENVNALPVDFEVLDLSGKSYIEQGLNSVFGVGVVVNNAFHFLYHDTKKRTFEVLSYDEKGNLVQVMSTPSPVAEEKRKYNSKLYYVEIENQLFGIAELNEVSTAFLIGKEKNEFQQWDLGRLKRVSTNPSRILAVTKNDDFIHRSTSGFFTFDIHQLGKSNNVVFIKQE